MYKRQYTGNPLACRAALATLDIFAQDNVILANRCKAARIGEAFRAAVGSHPKVRHLRQQGMILAFDVAGAVSYTHLDVYKRQPFSPAT